MAKKRYRKVRKHGVPKKIKQQAETPEIKPRERQIKSPILAFYDANYKKLMFLPFILLILAIAQISIQTATTGEFITRGVSLKGGTTITIPTSVSIDIIVMKAELEQKLPLQDVEVRILRTAGTQTAIVVESDATDKEMTDTLLDMLEDITKIHKDEYSMDVIGSSLGDSFFREIIFALIIAFVFMGTVVFLYFRLLVPSAAVILAAFSDMTITVAIVNILGLKISAAGIAAFLMLIGYSIDTNIMLSIRVLKRKEGTLLDRIIQSLKTGLTMSASTLSAVTVVLILSKSEVLTQIMTILFIGLLVDLLMTWVQNVGILRMYIERKKSE